MGTNHTRGSWKSASSGPGKIRGIDGPNGECIVRWGGIARPESEEGQTNARLMIAAPDLLTALEQQLAQWQLIANMADTDNDEVVSATIELSMGLIGNALRKARGEE